MFVSVCFCQSSNKSLRYDSKKYIYWQVLPKTSVQNFTKKIINNRNFHYLIFFKKNEFLYDFATTIKFYRLKFVFFNFSS